MNNEFIVKKNSLARVEEMSTIPGRAKLLRKKYIDDRTFVPTEDGLLYRFTRDVAFGSPSGAAQIVYGGSNNRRFYWKIKGSTQSYGDWREQKLESSNSAVKPLKPDN